MVIVFMTIIKVNFLIDITNLFIHYLIGYRLLMKYYLHLQQIILDLLNLIS